MLHFDGWHSMEGRHLVLAYAAVIVIQGGYLALTAWNLWRITRRDHPGHK